MLIRTHERKKKSIQQSREIYKQTHKYKRCDNVLFALYHLSKSCSSHLVQKLLGLVYMNLQEKKKKLMSSNQLGYWVRYQDYNSFNPSLLNGFLETLFEPYVIAPNRYSVPGSWVMSCLSFKRNLKNCAGRGVINGHALTWNFSFHQSCSFEKGVSL